MDHFFKSIQGWFFYSKLFTDMVVAASDGDHFVEVGAWKGCSSSFMAVEIKNSGKNIKYDVVDTWEGSPEHQPGNVEHHHMPENLYEEFLKNMEPVKDIFTPFKLPSVEAAKLYPDNSLKFVFIDAQHEYEAVKADIEAWYPKMKEGGIIAGHDYGDRSWPGVKQAVDEFFGSKVQTTSGSCWFVDVKGK